MRERKVNDEKWYYTFLPYNISGGSTSNLIPLFMVESLRASVAEVGIVSAITSVASVPANILWGTLSDVSKKRKPFILMGFLGMALSLLLMGLSFSLIEYYLANFMMGLLAAAIAPVGTVLVLETFAKGEWGRRLGDFSKVGGIGWVIGLVIGIVWLMIFDGGDQNMAMRWLFFLAAGLSLAALVLAIKWVPESKEKIKRSDIKPEDVEHVWVNRIERARYLPHRMLYTAELSAKNLRLSNFPPALRRYYVVIFLAFTGFLSFYVALPVFLLKEVSLSNAEVFIVYLASSIASALTYSWMGRLIGKIGGKKVQMVCFFGRIFIFPAFLLVVVVDLPFVPLFIILLLLHAGAGLCWAGLSVAGQAIVGKLAFKDLRTQSLGMYNSIHGLATIVGSLLGGFIASWFGYNVLFLLASVFIAIALVLLFLTDVDKEPVEKDVAITST